jgi:phage FluMu protein Com
MRTQPHEFRCKSCGILLAKIDDTGLTIRRGDLEASFDGAFRASLRCYRSRCRSLNVIRLSHEQTAQGPAA